MYILWQLGRNGAEKAGATVLSDDSGEDVKASTTGKQEVSYVWLFCRV